MSPFFKSKKQRSFILIITTLILLISLFCFFSLILGSVNIFTVENSSLIEKIILHKRLPETITALLAGASLSLVGMILQCWFKNPLAGPSILGISSGAGLGIALALMGSLLFSIPSSLETDPQNSLLGWFTLSLRIIWAIIGATLVIIPLLIISARYPSSTLLLLFGLLSSYLINAFISILIHFSSARLVKSYLNWTFGSFSQVQLSQIPLFSVLIILGLILALVLAPKLNQLALGDDYATSIGLKIKQFRLFSLLLVCYLTSLITLYCGPIAFIGIAAPHFARELLKSGDYRKLMPIALLTGSLLAISASLLSRLPGSVATLPLNALLALIGVPALLSLLLRPKEGGFIQ